VPVTLRLEGAEELSASLARSPQIVASEEARAMTASLLLLEADARRNVRHDTRRLMNSITSTQERRGRTLVGRVGPSVRYGLYVERGRRAYNRPPPVAALRGWARRHGIPERALYVLARKIGRRGIPARPFLGPAWVKNRDRIRLLFWRAGQSIVVRLGAAGRGYGWTTGGGP
jgi:hypothetical protein